MESHTAAHREGARYRLTTYSTGPLANIHKIFTGSLKVCRQQVITIRRSCSLSWRWHLLDLSERANSACRPEDKYNHAVGFIR